MVILNIMFESVAHINTKRLYFTYVTLSINVNSIQTRLTKIKYSTA